ncbi:glycosyltransferase domain-containing protein [Boseongicola sp. H5]|uniref:glycosyltransferase domain-containing protein n=1 Tax=Boseongicola sp. H5 TaxID=2763261 RepID=UPI001D09C0E2
MTKQIIVYKCADRSYDFSFYPSFFPSAAFTPRCVWLSHDGRARARGWQAQTVDVGDGPTSGKDFNRYCKFLPHQLLPECTVSIYVDGNVQIAPHATAEIEAFLESGADIALMAHALRHTISDEIAACRQTAKLSPEAETFARNRLDQYHAEGLLASAPVYYGGVLMRRHQRPALENAMRDWAREYTDGVTRDQISLPYVLWRNGVTIHLMTCSYVDPFGPFFAHRHKKQRWLSDLNQKRKILQSARARDR